MPNKNIYEFEGNKGDLIKELESCGYSSEKDAIGAHIGHAKIGFVKRGGSENSLYAITLSFSDNPIKIEQDTTLSDFYNLTGSEDVMNIFTQKAAAKLSDEKYALQQKMDKKFQKAGGIKVSTPEETARKRISAHMRNLVPDTLFVAAGAFEISKGDILGGLISGIMLPAVFALLSEGAYSGDNTITAVKLDYIKDAELEERFGTAYPEINYRPSKKEILSLVAQEGFNGGKYFIEKIYRSIRHSIAKNA